MNLTEQIIEQTALVKNIYAPLADLSALNAIYADGQVVYIKYADGSTGEVIGDGVTHFDALVNILLNSGGVNQTVLEYNTVPSGVITGGYSALVAKHGLAPQVSVWFDNCNHPELVINFDDQEAPTTFSIDLGVVPSTKTRVKFI